VNCPICGKEMKVIFTRDDGCRVFECHKCDETISEETAEWFNEMKAYAETVSSEKSVKQP
jgi:transposase-like protein